MIRKDIKLNFDKKGLSTVVFASCWHYGNPSVSKEGIHNLLKRVKNTPWLHLGDIIEGIGRGDKRFSVQEHRESLLYAMSMAAEDIKKANKSCIGLIKGNHDQTPSKDIGDVVEHISNIASVPYLSATFLTRFKCPKGTQNGFFAHGSGSTNPKAGDPERKQITRQIWLRNQLSQFNAGLCGMGHVHRFIVTPPCSEEKLDYGDVDNVKRIPIVTRPTWYFAAPSMFTTYSLHADTSNYAEMALYGATDIGWIEVVFERDGKIPCIKEVYHTGKVKQVWEPRIVG